MRDDSYNVPAIKYYISGKDIKKQAERFVIPFESVEGLSIDQIRRIPNNNITDEIWLTCCVEHKCIEPEMRSVNYFVNRLIISDYNLRISDILADDYYNTQIEKLFENFMIDYYEQVDDFGKTAIKCFLERYRCYSQEKIDKITSEDKQLVKKK